jgi:hypothetical protein
VEETTIKNKGKERKIDMDFLKSILSEDLFGQLESALNKYNSDEANKDKQIKLANLGGGDYVAKGKYDSELEKLNTLLSGKSTELDTANGLIEQLKKGTKGNEELQGKITGYENQVASLQKQLQQTRIEAAVKVALLSEKALDVPYLTFKVNEKLQEQGKALELDENDNIKGWDDLISGLKTQFPAQFESGTGGKGNVIEENKLPESNNGTGLTRADILKKPYAERQKLYNENPEAYKETMKND